MAMMLPCCHAPTEASLRRTVPSEVALKPDSLAGFEAHFRSGRQGHLHRFLKYRHLAALRLGADDKTRPQRQHLGMAGDAP